MPLGSVTVIGTRGGSERQWKVSEGRERLSFSIKGLAAQDALPCSLRAALDRYDYAQARQVLAEIDRAWETIPEIDRAWLILDAADLGLANYDSKSSLARIQGALTLRQNSDLFVSAVKVEHAAILHLAQRDLEASAEADEAIRRLHTSAPRSVIYGRALTIQAVIVSAKEGISKIDAAIDILKSGCGDCVALADAMATKHWILQPDPNEEVVALGKNVLALLQRIKPLDSRKIALRMIALAGSTRAIGDYPLAERLSRGGLALMLAVQASDDELAKAHSALGAVLWALGKYSESIKEDKICLDIWEKIGSDRIGNARNNLGVVLLYSGNVGEATKVLESAVAALKQVPNPGGNEARAHVNFANALEQGGSHSQALEELHSAMAIEGAAGVKGELLAGTLTTMARVYLSLGKPDEAAVALQRAEALSAGFKNDWLAVGQIKIGLGWLEMYQARPEKAAQYFDMAIQGFVQALPAGGIFEARARFGFGESLLQMGNMQNALINFSRAIELFRRDAPDQEQLALALNARARVYRDLGKHGEAANNSCEAAEVLRRASRRVADDAMAQAVYRERHSDVFRDCVETRLSQHDWRGALLKLEESRSRGFLDALVTREVNLSRRVPHEATLLSQLDDVRRERARIQRRLAEAKIDPPERVSLERDLVTLGERRKRAIGTLKRVAPEIAALEGEVVESVDKIQESLPKGGVALEYAVGFEDTLLFVLSKGAVQVVRIPVGRDALIGQILAFRQRILRRDLADVDVLREQGSALFKLLLAPVQETIAKAEVLVISPDGPLYDLPFAALWSDAESSYFGARWPLVFSDSLTTWTYLSHRHRVTRSKRRLAVADPDLPARILASSEIDALPKLPGARVEVEALNTTAPTLTDVLLGADANEIRVRQKAPGARLLHFAVHALLDARQPLDSSLVFASADASAAGDGLLHVQEVLDDMDLSADLVVLSGCDTARGTALNGEGLIGFTRAFQFAGADAVMASLWPVSDRPTAEFMEKFYQSVATGESASKALQRALTGTIDSTVPLVMTDTRGAGGLAPPPTSRMTRAHPYVWASFQLYGRSD